LIESWIPRETIQTLASALFPLCFSHPGIYFILARLTLFGSSITLTLFSPSTRPSGRSSRFPPCARYISFYINQVRRTVLSESFPSSALPSRGFTIYRWPRNCGLIANGVDRPPIAAGKVLGPRIWKIGAQLLPTARLGADPLSGFFLDIPLGENQAANERAGFGVRSLCKYPVPLFRLS
jgi:hypothetical protein